MATGQKAQVVLSYLDMQAYVGITKHNGGLEATDELLSLCHIEDAQEVLNAGCGIGVGSIYVARKHNCRVVGVDISEKMIEWSRLRASGGRVGDEVELQVADCTRDVTPRVVGGSTLARPFPAARNRGIGERLAFGRGPWPPAEPPNSLAPSGETKQINQPCVQADFRM